METIVSFIHQGFLFIIPLIILLGILIFVHELGHFLIAKYFKVKVEVFSLGFGKKLFSRVKGDTQYCLSAIPFGGYVKMYGDDPSIEIPDEQKAVSFLHKPVIQRIAIVLAGPLMNFFFAIFVFMVISMVGENIIEPIVGDLPLRSAAYQGGFRSGDRIVDVNGLKINTWDSFSKTIEANQDQTLSVTVNRENVDKPEVFSVKTSSVPNKNILSDDPTVGNIEGLQFISRAAVVGITNSKSLAATSGLKTSDLILKVDDVPVKSWHELTHKFNAPLNKTEITFLVERVESEKDSSPKQFSIKISNIAASQLVDEDFLLSLGIEKADLYVYQLEPKSAAQEAGLSVGDRIVSINSEKLEDWEQLVEKVQNFSQKTEEGFTLSYQRDGELKELKIIPRLTARKDQLGQEEKKFALGVMTAKRLADPLTFVQRTYNPIKALFKGLEDSLFWTKITCLSFLKIVQKKVSAKAIGGPIMIGQLASRTFQIGLSPFLKIMAIISINLFVLNLLPVPVLDGGHLLFFTIEAVRGSPLSMRKMEIAQQIGLVLLLLLMAFAVFNDVSRLLN